MFELSNTLSHHFSCFFSQSSFSSKSACTPFVIIISILITHQHHHHHHFFFYHFALSMYFLFYFYCFLGAYLYVYIRIKKEQRKHKSDITLYIMLIMQTISEINPPDFLVRFLFQFVAILLIIVSIKDR